MGAPWDPAQVLPWSLSPHCGCMSPVLSPARVIEYLYRQHCLEKVKEQPPGPEAAMEDELLVMDGSTMWQKVKEGIECPSVGGRCWGLGFFQGCIQKPDPCMGPGTGSKKFPLVKC